MKIYDVNLTSTSAAESGRSHEAQRAGHTGSQATGATGSRGGDHVELSSTLNSLARAMSSSSADRSAKVQALAAQFRSGTYQANSLVTSKGMISEALASGGKQ